MPALPNPKHELFAHGLFKGLGVGAAYVAAGYNDSPAAATRLSKNVKVRERVDELKSVAAEKAGLTKAWVIERLIENVNRAMQYVQAKGAEGESAGDFHYQGNVANKALELLGREIGMFVDRRENINTNYTISDEPMTKDEWAQEYGVETPGGSTGMVH